MAIILMTELSADHLQILRFTTPRCLIIKKYDSFPFAWNLDLYSNIMSFFSENNFKKCMIFYRQVTYQRICNFGKCLPFYNHIDLGN